MRDPHVASLSYDLKAHQTVTFDNPPPVERETEAFRLRLDGDIATFEMKEHFGTEQDARRFVEGWLRAWELDAALRSGWPIISFEFKHAEVVDRDPPPPGTHQVVKVSGSVHLTITAMPATLHTTHRNYPDPPTHFKVSPDVETMWSRYQGYVDGKEPLSGMAYFCLTVVDRSAGSRRKAAKQYSVAKPVLTKLGELTSNVGDRQTARKISASSTRRRHSPTEITWVGAAVRALIRRKGGYDSDPSAGLPQLTMNDLPTI